MIIKRQVVVFSIFFSLLFLYGCQQSSDDETNNDSIVDYEYLSLDEEYSDEINNWLSKARNDSDEDLYYLLSLDDGTEYVYGKGYNQAKVSYTYEVFDGKINSTIKTTLLVGESND